MAEDRSLKLPQIIGVLHVRLKPNPDPNKVRTPLQLCPYKTNTPTGAIHLKDGWSLAVCFADGWMCLQLDRENTCLVGLPLEDDHPAGTWSDSFENGIVEISVLDYSREGGLCWQRIGNWEEIPFL